MKFKKLLLLY